MKRIVDLMFRDLFTTEFSELLESWALIFAIVPFGALIFSGMYFGQFILDSTILGVLLMFIVPLAGFAVLVTIRKAIAEGRGESRPRRPSILPESTAKVEGVLVVVQLEAVGDKKPMYTLRRMDALENMYVQKGYATSVTELWEQVGAEYPDVNWTRIVEEPPKSLAASMKRKETQSA